MRCRAKEWQELAKASDDICKARNLQIIEESKGRGLAYQIYLAEKRGEPTRLNLAKAALDEALFCSASLRELEQRLRARGYIGNFEPGRKYWTIRQKDWQRPIRIQRMGKDYTNEGIMQRLKGVKETSGLETISFFRHRAVPQYRLPKRIHKIRKRGGLQGLYLHYCYLLGYLPKYRQNPKKVYYLYRDDLIKLRSISAEARFLAENQIESKEQLAAKKTGNEKLIESLQTKRCELRNMLRHVGMSEKEKKEIREKIAAISLQMKQFRREIHLCDSIERRTEVITERIRTGEREIEKQRQR